MPSDPFTDRLRSAADLLSPSFSPEMHAAVMRQVHGERQADSQRSPHRPAAARWAAAAAAAVVGVGIGIRAMRATAAPPRPVQPEAVAIELPSLPSWSDTVESVSRPVAKQLADARLDLVDRSAGRFARYCLDQLDVFPLPRNAAPSTNATSDVDHS